MTDKHEQKKLDIINAAFVQWSKDLYTNTSLTAVADALGMTKPALFRYFSSKDSLFDAMLASFTQDMMSEAADIMEDLENRSLPELLKVSIDRSLRFFIKHKYRYYFPFFTSPIIKARITKHPTFMAYREKMVRLIADKYQSYKGISLSNESADMMLIYLFYAVSSTYLFRKKTVYHLCYEPLTEEMFEETKHVIWDYLMHGFPQNVNVTPLSDEDFARIESFILHSENGQQRDKIFEAITSVIAECGIVEASMERIAKQMGLSGKSSLYSHFNSRDDMLQQLFDAESERILNFVKANGLRYDNLNEDMYGCMAATFCYFTSDPNVLRYFDWLHYQMTKESIRPGHSKMFRIFNDLADSIDERHHIRKETDSASPIMLSVVMLSTFIIRVIVAMNDSNGGVTSPEEVKDLREIYRLYMEGI